MPWDTCRQVTLFKTISPEISFPILLLELLPSALGGGRTHTWRILSPLPLPLGYEGQGGRVYILLDSGSSALLT